LAAPAPSAVEIARALAAVAAGEPDVAAVQAAAARAADATPVAGYARRARAAALLPRVTAELRRDERNDRVVGLQSAGEVDYLRLAPGTSLVLRATWDLGALVAAPGELAAAEQAGARARRRDEAAKRATELLFERRRLRLELLLSPPAAALERARAELEVDRLGAELDRVTGGLFSGRAP
jgi:hypothetical protein